MITNLWEETKPYQWRFAIMGILNLLAAILVGVMALQENWGPVVAAGIVYPICTIWMFQYLFTIRVQKDVLRGKIPHNEAAMKLLKEYKK